MGLFNKPTGSVPVSQVIDQKVTAETFSKNSFPSTLGGFGITMSFYEYSYSASLGNRAPDGVSGLGGSVQAAITLPLPSQLTDSYGVSIQGVEMGALGAAALDFASGASNDTSGVLNTALNAVTDAGAAAGGMVSGFTSASSAAKAGGAASATQYFLRSTVDSLFAGAGTALSVANKTAINPHLALTFEGVNLKNYSLSWRLAPKNASESESIRSIINTLRFYSLPEFQSVGGERGTTSLRRGLLKYPSIVRPAFVGIDANHFWHFKPCMISNITANYAPEGVALQAGGRPAVVDLEVQLTETTIHTRDDYDSSGSFAEIDV